MTHVYVDTTLLNSLLLTSPGGMEPGCNQYNYCFLMQARYCANNETSRASRVPPLLTPRPLIPWIGSGACGESAFPAATV